MVKKLEEYRIKKFIKKILPGLAPIQTEKISLNEAEKKLEELFNKAVAEDMSGKLFWVYDMFRKWLTDEKKLNLERATELSEPLKKEGQNETQTETAAKETKILPFKKNK